VGGVTRVRFISANGEDVVEAEAPAGSRLLDVAQANGQPLEGTCEGQMACSTCHVIVDREDFGKLTEASEMEDDLLDLAASVTRWSRLPCQVVIPEGLDSLNVHIPGETRNMQGR
jgi:ferredoxin